MEARLQRLEAALMAIDARAAAQLMEPPAAGTGETGPPLEPPKARRKAHNDRAALHHALAQGQRPA
jgi:hypothetical protein